MADAREKLIELVKRAITDWQHGDVSEKIADYLIANGVTVQIKKEKPPTDLTGKCGSCRYAVPAPEAFGGSPCYVKCTSEDHMRRYYGRPITRVRQRTTKACKKYQPKEVQEK